MNPIFSKSIKQVIIFEPAECQEDPIKKAHKHKAATMQSHKVPEQRLESLPVASRGLHNNKPGHVLFI